VHRIHREAAHIALTGFRTYQVVWRRTHWFCFFSYEISLVYIRMWQPRGSAPKGEDDVMAVMIRFSAMAQACPEPGDCNLI